MKTHRPASWLAVAIALAVANTGSTASAFQAEQLAGVVNSVDLEAKKIAVTPTGKVQNVDVKINDATLIETTGGRPLQLKDLKTGDGLGIAHVAGLASKIIVAVKPSELTGHVKTVGADLKTFVVTEIGTTSDVTVAITPDTSIMTSGGKKFQFKDLKKGDGVGISHVNSIASKIVVRVKSTD